MSRVELRLNGHSEWDVLADVWRLFFGSAVRDDSDCLEATWPDACERKICIESRVDESWVSTSIRTDDSDTRVKRERCSVSNKRRLLKRQLYAALADATGMHFPWGSLTGVRPTQMAAHECWRTGSQEAAVRALTDAWHVSEEKARLAVETNAAEQAILQRLPADALALYVGVPFCPSRCLYCSFTSRDASRHPALLETYEAAVKRELDACFSDPVAAYGHPVALYIGGGTPTTLADRAFDRMLAAVLNVTGRDLEITVEAGRPETITESKLSLLQSHGITRICINPQTMNDETLPKLNRHHDTKDVFNVFERARRFGMTDINMDLIAGLEGETPADFLYSVKTLIALGPEKITLHALAKKSGSFLHGEAGKGGLYMPLPDWIDAFEKAQSWLREAGFAPYYLYRQKYTHAGLENIGFAKAGHATVYNVAMMSDRVNVLGFGAGSSTKFIVGTKAHRLHNPKDVKLYAERAASLGSEKRAEAIRRDAYRIV